MVRISRFASKYFTTKKKKPKKLKDKLNEDQLAAFIAGKPTKKYAKTFKKQTGLSKKEMKRPDPDARAEFFGEKQPTGYMTADFGGKFGSVSKAQQRKAVSRSERLQMARFKNARKKSK